MSLSEKITALRTSKGITQTFIAECLNMDRGNYSRLEKRGDKMTVEQLIGIAKALSISPAELLGDESDKVNDESSKIKELESRIKVLEDRLKDKDFRSKAIERERVILEKLLFASLSEGLNHSTNPSDYQDFIKKYPWIVSLLSGMAFSGIKIKEPTWSKFWQNALNKFIKRIEAEEIEGRILLAEISFSLIADYPTAKTIDEFLEWVNDPANEVESVMFYQYISEAPPKNIGE